MIRIVIDERRATYNTQQQETTYTYEVTHELHVPDKKAAAGVLRAIAEQMDPTPKGY